jgi:hypothetical protein
MSPAWKNKPGRSRRILYTRSEKEDYFGKQWLHGKITIKLTLKI